MWPDKLIIAALAEHRGASGIPPIAYVPEERAESYGPVRQEQIQPASLDVRLGNAFLTHPSNEAVWVERYLELEPNGCILGTLVERVAIPDDVVGRVEGKSTWGRRFLTVHHTAGFLDPGFHGDVTLELKNNGHETLYLEPGEFIAQISFQWLAAPAMRPYGSEGLNSHYQNQKGPTAPWG